MNVNTNKPFLVGDLPLNRSQVNAETVAKLAQDAAAVGIEGNDTDWKGLADRVAKGDSVSAEDLKALQTFEKSTFKYHKTLHSEFRASGFKDETIAARLADVHVFREGFDSFETALQMASAKAAVEAVAGASFGPIGTVAAYSSYARLTEAALTDLCETLKDIEGGKSHTLHTGNKVEQVHQEKLWPSMHRLLDGAIEGAKGGKPVEIDAQYYELTSPDMVGKLAAAAEAGNKVRVNVDPGRLVAFKGSTVQLDDVPDKLRSLLALSKADGDIAVSVYPITKKLGDPNDLMHRKLLRVGEQVLLPGMNANAGSGENVDAGYIIEGPAGKKLGENFARDVKDSIKPTNADIYGEEPLQEFADGDIRTGRRGLVSLFDYKAGLSPAGTKMPKPQNFEELEALATKAGLKVADMFAVEGDLKPQVDEMIKTGGTLPMSKACKELFMELLNDTMKATRTAANVKKLKDIEPPSGKEVGATAVSLADQPTEREALLIDAVHNAEQFVYIPAFVMTRPVASALVARRQELKEQGKDLDIKVLVDPGVYPDGGTPNEYGIKFLEDHGIPSRWALLPRSGDHDRKVHAKQMLTDKAEFFGSTNFSNKGMRENWEHSGTVHFDPQDEAAMANRDQSKKNFEKMWEHNSFELSSKDLAAIWKSKYDGKDKSSQIEEARYNAVRKTIEAIENYEKESATFMLSKANDPEIASRVAELNKEGYEPGLALLTAVEEKMGTENFYKALSSLPSKRALDYMKPRKKADGTSNGSWKPAPKPAPSQTFKTPAPAGAPSKVSIRTLTATMADLKKLLEDGSPESIARSREIVGTTLANLEEAKARHEAAGGN